MNKTIQLKYDSRDKIYHQHFGQTFEFPLEVNYDTPLYDEKQAPGNVQCTCYTACDIAEDQDNIEFDIDDLWSRVKQSPDGADPRDVFGEAVKNGLLPRGKTERLKNWQSFWRADVGPMDAFDNVRSAMLLAKSPVGCGTYWYANWNGTVLPIGENPVSGHMYALEGWVQIEGKPHLIIEAWLGRKLYMSRETFNAAMKPVGMQAWVLSTALIDSLKVKSLKDTLVDLLVNLVIRLRDLLKLKQAQSPTVEPIVSVEPVQPQLAPSKYDWDTASFVRHSVRVISDEYFLTWTEKDVVCAVIQAESGFNPKAVNKNSNGTYDYGLCQINSFWHIGPDKYFKTKEEALDPEKSVRFMVEQFKRGNIKLWAAFQNKSYRKYLQG